MSAAANHRPPSFETLLDWIEGRLDPAQADEVRVLAEEDERVGRTISWLRGIIDAGRDLPLQSPPPLVRQSLVQQFRRWSRAQALLEESPQIDHAQLLFDSREDLALVGFRSLADGSEATHLAYTARVADLLLDVHPEADGRVRIDGQVLMTSSSQAVFFEASATGVGFQSRTVDGDDIGRFSIKGVPNVPCRVTVTNGELTIVADVNLGPRGGDQ